jgi:hypothetical protein
MRLFFTCLVLLVSGLTAGAQVLFQQNFEYFNSYQIPGWPQEAYGFPWQTGYSDALASTCFMPADNKTKVAGVVDTWGLSNDYTCVHTWPDSSILLTTPIINFTGYTHVFMQYDSYFWATVTNGKTESATIEISTDSGLTWTVVQQVQGDITGFHTWYANLSAFVNHSNVRLGFRYKDQGEHMSGWMIDNIKVFVPQQVDLGLLSASPKDSVQSYRIVNTAVQHVAEVFNYGFDTIANFNLYYKKDNEPERSFTSTGVAIPPLTMQSIAHPYFDTIATVAKSNIRLRVAAAGDAVLANDTARTTVSGTAFMPKKMQVVEEGTGTWNYFGPRGWVYMNHMKDLDLNILPISVHAGDPMGYYDYSDYLFYVRWNYVPYLLLDRRMRLDWDMYIAQLYKHQDDFGFATLNLAANLDGNNLDVNVQVTPAINLVGDYRLALVITEDSVRGTAPGYGQFNGYSGGAMGPMGGFENKPDTVAAADMFYNYVARKIFPAADGQAGQLPASMTYGGNYSYNFHTSLNPAWNRNRLRAAVLLINNSDSTVLNAKQVQWFLDVKNPQLSMLEAGVYPNPARDMATVFFSLNKPEQVTISVMDISGRAMVIHPGSYYPAGRNEYKLPTGNLANGIYIVTLSSETGKRVLKMEIIH